MALTKEELLQLKEKILQLKEIKDIEKILPNKMSAYQYLKENNNDRLDCIAINYLGRLYTFKELLTKIDVAAKGFNNLGIKPGDKVAMGMLSTPEAIINFYALNKLGANVYMVNATHEKEAIRREIKESGAKVLLINDIFYDKDVKKFCDEAGVEHVIASSLDDSFPILFYKDKIKFKLVEFAKKIGNACKTDPRCEKWLDFMKKSKEIKKDIEPYYEPKKQAVISSTSGSLGTPKSPALTNESMNAMVIQSGMTCDVFAPNDSILTTLPTWILYSLFNSIHEPLCLGVTVNLDPLFNAKKVSERFKQYRFNHWSTIPSYIEDMTKDRKMKNLDLSFLKTITTGGDYRSPKLKQKAEEILKKNNSNCEIGQGYGSSELGGSFSYTYERNMPAESAGKPLVGNKIKVLDIETGELCGNNKTGEIYLYSPTLMQEYFNNQEETAKSLVKDQEGITWYKTEDTGYIDSNGIIYLGDRLRRIEITKGSDGNPTKVFPSKIMKVVSKHPSLEQCEIVMMPDKNRITKPVAFIIMKDGYEFNKEIQIQLKELCLQEKLESYTIPEEYIVINEMPKKTSQKNDLDKLKEMYVNYNKDNLLKSKFKKLIKTVRNIF